MGPIIALICICTVIIIVSIIVLVHNTKHEIDEEHAKNSPPLYVIDGKLMNTYERKRHEEKKLIKENETTDNC